MLFFWRDFSTMSVLSMSHAEQEMEELDAFVWRVDDESPLEERLPLLFEVDQIYYLKEDYDEESRGYKLKVSNSEFDADMEEINRRMMQTNWSDDIVDICSLYRQEYHPLLSAAFPEKAVIQRKRKRRRRRYYPE